MVLKPEIEQELQACEARNAELIAGVDILSDSIDELVRDMEALEDTMPQDVPPPETEAAGGGVVTEEAFDDPSVVRHVDALKVTTERAKRISDHPPTLYAVHGRSRAGVRR